MKLRVLTIDGGGIRGIIPTAILAYLETKIQEISKKPSTHLIDYIDFIAGTGTGSITAASMILPDEKGKVKYSMNNIVDFYINLGPKIFIPKKNKWKTFLGIFSPILSEENVEKVYLHIFSHHKIKELIKPALFPAYDIDKGKVVLYTTTDLTYKYGDFFVKDVIRGATAIPFLYRPGYFRNGVNIHTIIDGSLIATNPSNITLFEVFKQGHFPEEIIFISLGTGISKHIYNYKYEETKNWSRLKWFLPLIDIIKSANIEIVSYQLKKTFEFRGYPENYIRINPPIEYASRDLYDASKDNIHNLIRDAEEYIEENKEQLDALAQRLYDCN